MNVNEFAKMVAERETGKKEIDIAQIKEVLKIVNGLTHGLMYAIIQWLD